MQSERRIASRTPRSSERTGPCSIAKRRSPAASTGTEMKFRVQEVEKSEFRLVGNGALNATRLASWSERDLKAVAVEKRDEGLP